MKPNRSAKRRAERDRACFVVVQTSPDIVWLVDMYNECKALGFYKPPVVEDPHFTCRELYDKYGDRRFALRDHEGNWGWLHHDRGRWLVDRASAREPNPPLPHLPVKEANPT